ncbi:hypothetical protein BD626DRAFT_577341 [Schizophyllum amplum]|uniref:Uncharacterized protein n=1 Tax=Schizophyllum amplum TaxID=97359 RepID=A0A550BSN1_9AGAR|nr:hypothetical protein BD626DRAFT_577341 [Auriculariopsis ampla]
MIIARTGEEERRWFESREDDSDEGNGTSALSKTILEWLFLAIAVFLLCSIFARRYAVMKRANQPISQFFRAAPQWASPPRPSRAVPCSQPCPRSVVYAEPFPSAHLSSVVYAAPLQRPRRSRRTRGAGTDARGRRLESGENDHDSFDDKDVLPAYETIGGPPRYDELAVPLPVALRDIPRHSRDIR